MMQYNQFQAWKRIFGIVFGFACIVIGLESSFSSSFGLLLIAAGAIVLSSLNAPAKALAKTLCDGFGGNPPFVNYTFSPEAFTYAENGEPVPYSSVVRLVDDGEFLYIYVSKKTAYMVSDFSVEGNGGLPGLKKLLAKGSGQEWRKPKKYSLLSGIYGDADTGLFSGFSKRFKK